MGTHIWIFDVPQPCGPAVSYPQLPRSRSRPAREKGGDLFGQTAIRYEPGALRHVSQFSPSPEFADSFGSLIGFDKTTVFMPYGHVLRTARRLFTQALHPRVVIKEYTPVQMRASHILANTLLADPDGFYQHVQRFVALKSPRFDLHSREAGLLIPDYL